MTGCRLEHQVIFKMNTAIGILSYNRPASLVRCLDSLFANLDASVPVAVNFDSWDPEMARIARLYPIEAINGEKQGIPFANNRLMQHFKDYDAVFLVQDDIRFLRPEWLDRYREAVAAADYLAFFDTYYPLDRNRPRHYHINYFSRRDTVSQNGVRLWQCCKSPQGAFQAISRNCIKRIGYFDIGFGRYGSEHHDYWLRACNAGFSPRSCFYDVVHSGELLKIDWSEPPSLDKDERDQAYREAEKWRRELFNRKGRGYDRVRVDDTDTADIHVLKTDSYQPEAIDEIPSGVRTDSELLKEYWCSSDRLPVLMYHSVGDTLGDPYAVHPNMFKAQMSMLADHFRFVTAAQALDIWSRKGRFSQDLAMLTFDDGYLDFMEIAPLLEKLSIPATVFVPVNWIGQENQWDRGAFTTRKHMDWNNLKEIIAFGHEVGSHTCDHTRLSRLSDTVVRQELVRSRETIQDRLGQPVQSIAYPFGSISPHQHEMVSKYYKLGFTTVNGVFDWKEGRVSVRRISINASTDLSGLLTEINNYMMQASPAEPVWRPTGRQSNP